MDVQIFHSWREDRRNDHRSWQWVMWLGVWEISLLSLSIFSLKQERCYKLRIAIGKVVLEILVQRRGYEIAIYQSGWLHKDWTFSMTALYNQDADLEDPYMDYQVQNAVTDLRKKGRSFIEINM